MSPTLRCASPATRCALLAAALGLLGLGTLPAAPLQLAKDPALSPDGATLAFTWHGDLWTVPTRGGVARRLTSDPASDSEPAFSPDGRTLAFLSERDRSRQVFLMPAEGGEPRRLTGHTEGYGIEEWLPDGQGLLVNVVRDRAWTSGSRSGRLAVLDTGERHAERMLFDDYGSEASVSPDGGRVLLVREGEAWWRQGYHGSRAGQIWLLDRADGSCRQVKGESTECRWPRWRPDGRGFFYVANRRGSFQLWEHDLTTSQDTQRTHFATDSVLFPTLSRDGRTLVFRHGFDFYRWQPGEPAAPQKIAIEHSGDEPASDLERLVVERATDLACTADGLQIAFVAGGDVWVMDTELREPRQVTHTPEEERDVVFAPDGKSLWFVSDAGGQADLWKAVPQQPARGWWENASFTLTRVTDDPAVEARPQFTRDGRRLVFLKGPEIWVGDGEGRQPERLVAAWDGPGFDLSPDGAWIAYARSDEWFNRDIWLARLDRAQPPVNLSRHPDNDTDPVWSPDGRMVAWSGHRELHEVDIHYVWLRAEDEERTKRERTLLKAREKIRKAATPTRSTTAQTPAPAPAPKPVPPVQIDLPDLHERIHRLVIPNATETSLVWSPDAKKLAFSMLQDGKRGLYTVELPDEPKPKLLAATTSKALQWLKHDDQIVGLAEGVPTAVSGKGVVSTFRFRAPLTIARADQQRAVFDQCWRILRDRYYDERLGNRDWTAIRAKYAAAAAQAPDLRGAAEVVQLMLGELNGSHLGFTLNAPAIPANTWREETAHLGLRFDPAFPGPGWKVQDVLRKGPASRRASQIEPGEILLRIEGRDLDPAMDPGEVLNGPLDRDLQLRVRAIAGAERDVTLRPIGYPAARHLLYLQWIEQNRAHVEKTSGGALGYLHISKMDDASFQRFQEELYAAGAGHDGLIIDVRENGGGSTADHLLTALTQPRHAITVPRGGAPGYPQDRIVFATWSKPIAVLCNQNSFSNAEIFSHAIKTLQRGPLIGVPTAGGVISTGSTEVMGLGILRLPFRGWFLPATGEDMELHGAQPDHLLWPAPGDLARGVDLQLQKAIVVLQTDVATWRQRPQPVLRKASER